MCPRDWHVKSPNSPSSLISLQATVHHHICASERVWSVCRRVRVRVPMCVCVRKHAATEHFTARTERTPPRNICNSICISSIRKIHCLYLCTYVGRNPSSERAFRRSTTSPVLVRFSKPLHIWMPTMKNYMQEQVRDSAAQSHTYLEGELRGGLCAAAVTMVWVQDLPCGMQRFLE